MGEQKRMLANGYLMRAVMVPLLAFSILFVTGCSGCRDDGSAVAEKKKEEAKKKKEKKKPDFENRMPVLLPAIFPKVEEDQKDGEPDDEENKSTLEKESKRKSAILEARLRNRTKLGHWSTAYFQVIANNFNASGEFTTSSIDSGSLKPIPILATDYYIQTTRPASLAKGEWKSLEASVYLPRRRNKDAITTNVNYELNHSTTGLTMLAEPWPTNLMKPFQYHIVVLSNGSQAYNYMTSLDSVLINETVVDTPFPSFYFVVPSRPGYPVPLPRQSLNWTTIAYVLWGDFRPDQLDENQQIALLDWIHQGGQLILSGPDCLDKLRGSFLDEYLPAEFVSTYNLSNADVDELNEFWSVPVAKNKSEKRSLIISPDAPLVGVKYKSHLKASFVEQSGELAIERRVGRGRIVATAFSLDDQQIRNWRSFNSFFNGCLLRRPAREFDRTLDTSVTFRWVDDGTSIFDPLVGSTLRYLSRDLNLGGTPDTHNYRPAEQPEIEGWRRFGPPGDYQKSPEEEFLIKRKQNQQLIRDKSNVWRYGGYTDDARFDAHSSMWNTLPPQSGTAGWNDASAVSQAARETLKQAAGISPPSSGFVLKMLAAYLLVLIPLNWLVFKLIGRVEWAWVAAPIIAIAGAFTVVKMASLDIGFVRSNTQIGLLELHADYPRGHMAEYSALYTSLSTGYDVEFDNPSAQSLPFAKNLDGGPKREKTISQVTLDRSRDNQLKGFQVGSNSTGMLHTEYTVDLDGAVSLEQNDDGIYSVVNLTRIDIAGAAVVRRTEQGDYLAANIGLLKSGDRTDGLQFQPIPEAQIKMMWLRNPEFVSTTRMAEQIWEKEFGNLQETASIEKISLFSEVESQWTDFQKLLLRSERFAGMPMDALWAENLRFGEFNEIMRSLTGKTGINVGRMFDVVIDNLELELGEMRLIGHSDQSIGGTRFIPESTQTDRQTLIVVHLKKGKLPPAKRDVNALADFGAGRSNLDYPEDE